MIPNSEKTNKIVKQDETESIGINLYDIDGIIARYMEEQIVPQLEKNGEIIKVPLLYGNSERWNSAKKDGYLLDREGKLLIPLVMFKRNSIAKNDTLKFLKEEQVSYPTIKKFSKKNAYDRFSVQNPELARVQQTYDVRMPDYINLVYEVVIWTNFTEHNNKIVEAFTYASERYWGEKDKYKFRVNIDNFENTTDLAAAGERVVRTSFTMNVFAYVLPKRLESVPTTQKGFTSRKVIVTNEVSTEPITIGGTTRQSLTTGGGTISAQSRTRAGGVTLIGGTLNQIFVNGSTASIAGAVILSLPSTIDLGVASSFTATSFTGSILATNGIISSSQQIFNFGFITSSQEINTSSFATTGSNIFVGNQFINGGIIYGTSSWANNSQTASFVITAQTASYILNAVSSSFASTASFVETSSWARNAVTSSFVTLAQSASYVLNSVSSSFSTTASYVKNADTASHITDLVQDVYITGSLFVKNNFSVLGTSSIVYVTSSQLDISTNIITVNTDAAVNLRFGGLAVIDSGSSPKQSGSILYDSVQDEWIFVHRGASNVVTSSHFLVGPETYDSLGNEIYIPANQLIRSIGNEHVTGSRILDDGVFIILDGNTQISGSTNLSGSFNVMGVSQFGEITASVINATQFTGSLFGTASWSQNAISSSVSQMAISSSLASTASFAISSISSSVSITASFSVLSQTASFVETASFSYNAATASYVPGLSPSLIIAYAIALG